MKRILKSIEWRAGESLADYYKRIGVYDKLKTLENNHEKPTTNPYATYLCIDSNSK